MASPVIAFPVQIQKEEIRPLGNFSPCLWGDYFLFFSADEKVSQRYEEEIDKLKEEVRSMVNVSASGKAVEKLNLINTIERLGISYHFEKEIEEQMEQLFNDFNMSENDLDLYNVALCFRLFRQHGFKVSCGIFDKFKDSEGKFKKTLTNDVKGMLSLYESAHLSILGEDILDDALAFATSNLKSVVTNDHLCPHLMKQVEHALIQPLHNGLPRIEAWHYISFYEEDPSKNELLLRFAKLDFNYLQMLHKQELSELTRWRKDLNLAERFPYARDRLVEIYLWANGIYFEPQYSRARVMLTKDIYMSNVIDDTYDAYGTPNELKMFTDAMQRWHIEALDQLPENMKILCETIMNLFEEFERDLTTAQSYFIVYAKDRLKELLRAYHDESKWCYGVEDIPPLEEYINTALISTTFFQIVPTAIMGMDNIEHPIEVIDWLSKNPKMVMAGAMIWRYEDDVITYETEKGRGQVETRIDCYMKEKGVSKEEAMEEFMNRAKDARKIVNEECLKPTPVPKHVLARVLNNSRMMDVFYAGEDGISNPENNVKDHITKLFVHHFLI